MKKILKFLPLLLIAVLGITVASCSDDKEEPVPASQLPELSKTFVSTYFPSVQIKSVQKEHDEFEVVLSDGTQIEFYKNGEWINVDAPDGKTIPNGFYPAAIDEYIGLNFDGAGINEISIVQGGFEVELVNGIDLFFNPQGEFLGYQPD